MTQPAEMVGRVDTSHIDAPAGREALRGFAVMSLPFAGGDVLCLRSWPTSSFGPAYDSVWHRSAAGAWTVYHSVPAELACPRFVGAALTRTMQTTVRIAWTGPNRLRVRVDDAGLVWDLELGATAVTRLMNGMMALMPALMFRSDLVLSMMGLTSTALFSAGRFRLRGVFPNRQWFQAAPRKVWMVVDSRASIGGRDLGPAGPLATQPTIGDIPLPQRGVFMVGGVVAEAYSPLRHRAATPGLPLVRPL